MTKKLVQRMLMYRYQGQSLEIYMEKLSNCKHWQLPENFIKELEDELNTSLKEYSDTISFQKEEDYILLDPVANEDGELEHIVALEDQKDNDSSYFFPELKEGNFFEFKEALKQVMPKQYKLIKELHEILEVRNIMKNI